MEQQRDDEELSHVTWVDAGGRENGMCKGPVVDGKMENEVSKEGRVHIWGSTKWSMVGNGMQLFYPKRKRGKLWSILNMRVIVFWSVFWKHYSGHDVEMGWVGVDGKGTLGGGRVSERWESPSWKDGEKWLDLRE